MLEIVAWHHSCRRSTWAVQNALNSIGDNKSDAERRPLCLEARLIRYVSLRESVCYATCQKIRTLEFDMGPDFDAYVCPQTKRG